MEDLQTIRGRVLPLFKLNDLKALIKTINERVKPAPGLKISGNKKELNDRIYELLSKYNEIGNQDTIQLIRSCINSVRGNQVSFSGSGPSISSMQPRVATPATTTVPTARPTSAMAGGSSSTINPGLITRPNSTASAMVSGHHHRSQQQHDGGSSMMGMNMVSSSSSSLYGQSVRMFKPSPFYKEVETLCPPRLCTEAKERTMNVILQFTTTPTLAARLKADPELQVMIFCGWADTPPGQQILMEFPSVCEVKVNQRNLEANLRGMKNKPGTVAPGNITRLCRLEPTGFNRIDFVYVNTTKKYNVSLHLVKRTSVDSLIRGIQRGKFLSKERMLQIIADRNRDADVVVSASTLSLKCPLGFVRINIPCRSSYCHHLQCFDGYTFFHLNEQTPTWTCPVCSRNMLSWEEIVVDGYFTDILQNTPSSLESVTVQPDGKWEIPSSGKVAVVAETRKATPAPEAKKKVPHDVFVLDDDDDEGDEDARGGRSGDDNDVEEVDGRRSSTSRDRRSAETPDHQPQAAQEPKQPEIEVIDLISDSEDEDGDAVMQAASLTLQEMANARPNSAAAVKAETVEPSSVATSRSGSTSAPTSTSTASRGTEAAPLISNVAAPTRLPMTADVGAAVATAAAAAATTIATPATMTESPGRGSSERSPQSTTSSATTSEGHSRAGSAANGWDHGEQENFMHQLIGTNRRKRQYEVDNEMQNMTTEARQRISRMELHSRASSERGSSSAVQSPDAPGRSTSSPSPATGGGGANDDLNSTRHVHQDRISGLIYDNLSAAAAAAAVVVSSPSTSSPEAMAAPTSAPGVYPHTSYASQNQQNHYRARPPTSQHHHHQQQQQQQQQQHAGYPASSHTQSRSVAPPADYYSGYSRAPSTEHLRSSSSSAPVPSNSVSPPLHSSSSSSSTSLSVTGWSSGGGSGGGGGGSGSGSSNMWRGGQDHPGSTSTWPSDVASSRPTSSSNGMYASTPASAVAGTAINPYAPRLSTLEELGRAAGILGYSSSSSPSSASSSSNVTSHPQHGYQRQHQSMGYASSPASSTGGGGGGSRRGYDHRDVSQTSPYAHRGGSSGGYSHGRSHSSSSHGYPGQQQQQQQQQHGAQRRENGVMMVDSRSPSASQRSGYNGSGGDEDGYPHPQHHHRHHQHHHHQHHPHHHQHHSTGPNNEMQQRQMADDLEEEEEVVEQGYGKPIFVPGVRGARAR